MFWDVLDVSTVEPYARAPYRQEPASPKPIHRQYQNGVHLFCRRPQKPSNVFHHLQPGFGGFAPHTWKSPKEPYQTGMIDVRNDICNGTYELQSNAGEFDSVVSSFNSHLSASAKGSLIVSSLLHHHFWGHSASAVQISNINGWKSTSEKGLANCCSILSCGSPHL